MCWSVKVVKVIKVGAATNAFKVFDEWRVGHWHKNGIVSANLHGTFWIACLQSPLTWSICHQLFNKFTGNLDVFCSSRLRQFSGATGSRKSQPTF